MGAIKRLSSVRGRRQVAVRRIANDGPYAGTSAGNPEVSRMLFVFWLVSTLFVGLIGTIVASIALARRAVLRIWESREFVAAEPAWDDRGGASISTLRAAATSLQSRRDPSRRRSCGVEKKKSSMVGTMLDLLTKVLAGTRFGPDSARSDIKRLQVLTAYSVLTGGLGLGAEGLRRPLRNRIGIGSDFANYVAGIIGP